MRIVQLINKFIPEIKEAYEEEQKRLPGTQAKYEELDSQLVKLQTLHDQLVEKLDDFKFRSNYDVTSPEYRTLEKDVYGYSLQVRDLQNQYNGAKYSLEVRKSQ